MLKGTPTREDALDSVRTLLMYIGEDPDREGLLDTPRRVINALTEATSGMVNEEGQGELTFAFTLFDAEGADEMVVIDHIPFASTCEHHLLPFTGEATVAYIPTSVIAGLSKIPRAVNLFARRLQNQERITRQVHDFLRDNLNTENVAVVLAARHTCMECRGVRATGSVTTTTALGGSFKRDPNTRAEFFGTLQRSAL